MFPHQFGPYAGNAGNYSCYHNDWYNRRDSTFRQGYRQRYLQNDSRWRNSDISHIIASNNGGINANENVFMFDRSMNRSIADSMYGQEINAALAGRNRAITAARVSRQYGSYTGPTGSYLHDRGSSRLKRQGILVRNDGGVAGITK